MPLKPPAEYELLAAQAHAYLCAGQIPGLRMALCRACAGDGYYEPA
jgi:hypothetical protein